MKKIVIYLLCSSIFFQSVLYTHAAEINYTQQNAKEKTEITELENKTENILKTSPEKVEEKITEEEQEETEKEIPEKEQDEVEEKNLEEERKEVEEVIPEEKQDEVKGEKTEEEPEVVEEIPESEQKEVEETIPEKEQEIVVQSRIIDNEINEKEQIIIDSDDPQYGRENGYVNDGFYEQTSYAEADEYVHNSRFENYIIKDVIDVSYYQGSINWEEVKQSGIDYAMIRAGFRGYEKATLNKDANFDINIKNALAAGIKVGVYFFSQAITEQEAEEEAVYLKSLIEGYKLELPVAIDFEYASTSEGVTGRLYEANLSKEDATKICTNFCETIENSGYTAMLYANKEMLLNRLNVEEISKKYMIWLANYGKSTSYGGEYNFWQYTQNGKVDGIAGTVDKSFWYKECKQGELKDGIYTIHSALDYNKVVDIAGASNKSGANVQLYSLNNTVAQQFVLEHLEGLKYRIYSYNSQMSLTVQGGNSENGTNICQHILSGTVGQTWEIIPAGNGFYKIISDIDGKAMDVAGGQAKDGTNIQIFVDNGTKAQMFKFENIQTNNTVPEVNKKLSEGTYVIATSLDEEKVLDIRGGSIYAGANVHIYNANNTQAQEFVIRYDANSGYYSITSKRSGMSVVYENGILQNSVNVYQDSRKELKGSEWSIHHKAGGYYIFFAADSEYCLDVAGGSAHNGANVQIYTANGTNSQLFYLKKISDSVETPEPVKEDLEEGVYKITTALSNTKVLDVPGGAKENGVSIQLYEDNNTEAQKFIVKKLENGYYSLISVRSRKLLTVRGGGNVNGSNVYQQEAGNIEEQQWKIVPAGNGYYTLFTTGGKALDVYGGQTDNGTIIHVHQSNFSEAQLFKFTSVNAGSHACFVNESDEVKINYEALVNINYKSSDSLYYLMRFEDDYNKTVGEPLASVDKYYDISISADIPGTVDAKELAMGKLVLATKRSDGSYYPINEPVYISNPEILAVNQERYFYPNSKKGLQGADYADAADTNSKHTLFNIDLANLVGNGPQDNYVEYTYKDNKYYFYDCSNYISEFKQMASGYGQYIQGETGEKNPVSISLCVLLSYNENNSYLIDPMARVPGHKYYMLNVREKEARETLEAAFIYLGEIFGKEDCFVTNWILGNEVNSSQSWNYSGNMDFSTYVQCYVTAFRLLYNGVKLEKSGTNVFISLDNSWNAVADTYSGKYMLDTFAFYMNAQYPSIEWNVAYHGYSYPLSRTDFWNDYSNTTDSINTPYISMRNIYVLTNYLGQIEKKYVKKNGSIRVILSEQGYTASGATDSTAEAQARALARGYYIAEFNDRVDAFIIRAIIDDLEEMKGGLYLGLKTYTDVKRITFYTYEYMDSSIEAFANRTPGSVASSSTNQSKVRVAQSILGGTNWESIIPGFSRSKLAGMY